MADNDYSPGDLVWAKIVGHPWWPALICNNPEQHTDNNSVPVKLHVQFFSQPPSHAWVNTRSIHVYEGKDVEGCLVGGQYYTEKKGMVKALEEIEKAQFLTHEERLMHFCAGDKIGKKQKMPAQKPHDKNVSKCHPTYKRYKLDKTKIPRRWKEAFVLMDTADVPEDLKPGELFFLSGPGGKRMRLDDVLEDFESDVNDIDSDDEVDDSDEDPGWTPGADDADVHSTNRLKQAVPAVYMSDDDHVPDDIDGEDDPIDDSDEDLNWSPGPKSSKVLKKPPQVNKRKPTKSSKTIPKTVSTPKNKKSSSTTKVASTAGTESSSKQPSEKSSKIVVVKDSAPTGPQPESGDFIIEKSTCKDGEIPHLWQYKRGGLLQKYERIEENGKVLYANLQHFCDWWGCYANRYQPVKTKLVYRFRNTEKVELADEPVIQAEDETPANTEISPPKDTVSHDTDDQSTQEQEISSTTSFPDDQAFQTGRFVLAIRDRSNVDNYVIWKIESNILLKKYEAVVKNGRILHKPSKSYRGYKDIEKEYLPIKVNIVRDLQMNEEMVEVTEDTRPKISIDSSLEEEYERSPLLRHFYVYMQVFLSQALEPEFLADVKKSNDQTYIFPLSEIDKIVEQKKINIERKVKWTDKIKDILNKCPYLREVSKPDENKTCEGKVNSKETMEESVFLFGSVYDKDTLKQTGHSHPATEFRIGKTCMEYISTYHQLCHFKYNLYDKCLAKIKLIRDRHEGIEVEKIMDECLGNKTWVLLNFEHFMNLVEMM